MTSDETAKRLTTIPGVGAVTAAAITTFAPPKMLVAVALANRMARTAWALLRKGEDYRDPGTVAA
ncbi:hypothetical protein EV667_4011 [Ancylobacter aquaticus]|uniref:IS110 family transposase n=1 Tax=Ancylobacter aquaticus TaxID=100 RepID=A0A4R1HJ91_ANCAQ|nr:hypothetical protein EV667_4011 [Ancylobacter aquaticus]